MLDGMQENHVPDLDNILQYFRLKTSFDMPNFTWICFKKAHLTFLERIANEPLGAHFPLLIRPRPLFHMFNLIIQIELILNKCGNLGFKSESYVYFKK
jgi:hypothetical protein